MPPFWYPGEKQEGHEGVRNQIFIDLEQFLGPPPYKNHEFNRAELTRLSFDGFMSILSWGGTSWCNFEAFRPLPPAAFSSRRLPKAVICEVQCLHFGTLGEAGRARGGPEPDFH